MRCWRNPDYTDVVLTQTCNIVAILYESCVASLLITSYITASPQCCMKFVLQVLFFILSTSITSMLQQLCIASRSFHPVQQNHVNTTASLCCKSHFSSCPAISPQYCIKFVLQVSFFILSSSITSVLHHVCVARPNFHPVQQHHLSIASCLCCRAHFSSCPAVSPQYYIKFVLQVPFFILSSSITSVLHQVCVASPIFHPVQQHQLSTAASLCFKFIFSPCSAVSSQCCSRYVLQINFFTLFSSINSILNHDCVANPIFHHFMQYQLNFAL